MRRRPRPSRTRPTSVSTLLAAPCWAHPLLSGEEGDRPGEAAASQNATTTVVACSSLAAVGRLRRAYLLTPVLPALLSLASLERGRVPSVQHCLKTTFVAMLKLRALEGTEWPERVADALAALGARDALDTLRRGGEYVNLPASYKRPSAPAAAEPPLKKPKAELAAAPAAPVPEPPAPPVPVSAPPPAAAVPAAAPDGDLDESLLSLPAGRCENTWRNWRLLTLLQAAAAVHRNHLGGVSGPVAGPGGGSYQHSPGGLECRPICSWGMGY